MEIKIPNAKELKWKTVHKTGAIFGCKAFAGKKVMVVLLEEDGENKEETEARPVDERAD